MNKPTNAEINAETRRRAAIALEKKQAEAEAKAAALAKKKKAIFHIHKKERQPKYYEVLCLLLRKIIYC